MPDDSGPHDKVPDTLALPESSAFKAYLNLDKPPKDSPSLQSRHGRYGEEYAVQLGETFCRAPTRRGICGRKFPSTDLLAEHIHERHRLLAVIDSSTFNGEELFEDLMEHQEYPGKQPKAVPKSPKVAKRKRNNKQRLTSGKVIQQTPKQRLHHQWYDEDEDDDEPKPIVLKAEKPVVVDLTGDSDNEGNSSRKRTEPKQEKVSGKPEGVKKEKVQPKVEDTKAPQKRDRLKKNLDARRKRKAR